MENLPPSRNPQQNTRKRVKQAVKAVEPVKTTKRVAVHTLGCRLNQAETALIAHGFERQGYTVVNEDESPDVCVVNTCTVTEQSSAKSRQIIRSLSRQNPDAQIAVAGCYAQIEPEIVSELEGVAFVIGNEAKLNIAEYLESSPKQDSAQIIRPKLQKRSFSHPFSAPPFTQQTRFQLKIQDGCNFMCSFCIIPFARGRSRYREFEDIRQESRLAVQAGVQEIVITGVNIGTYEEGQHDLVKLVDFLNDLSGLARIRISSIEPTTLDATLLSYMADESHKLVPFLHLPLQSGADSVLQNMKRRYTTVEYAAEVAHAYNLVPNLCIGTDIMTGFPGETQENFDGTWNLLNELPLAYFHVFPFSARQGTPAAKMDHHIDPKEKQIRSATLRKLSQQKRHDFQQRFLGSTQKVLLESRKDGGQMEGYTENYIRVVLKSAPAELSQNQIVPLQLKQIEKNYVLGEFACDY